MSRLGRKNPFKNLHNRLSVETLENRITPTCNVISGYVYFDANSNGLFDAGESPIANSQIELRNAAGTVVGSTTTDAAGYYEFEHDASSPGTDQTLTKTVSFGPTQTNFNLQGLLEKFDPSLGTLQSIELQHSGSITSEIEVENFSNISESDISGTVSGTMTLTAPGVNDVLNISGYAGAFHASTYDGVTDFAGASGESFGEQTADGSNTITLTGAGMDAYIGIGTANVSEAAVATSNATGGGNLDVRVRSTGASTITVTYHYKEADCLAPGDYQIVQIQQPDGFLDGLESKEGVVLTGTIGTDFIDVALNGVDLPNNNFGELMQTSLSGHVWHDANNDGVRDPGEDPIPGTTITLDGPGGPQTTTTDAAGFYEFTNLTAGTYTVTETQPTDYLDGKDNAGTKGGTVVNDPAADQIQTITLAAGDISENNDFGEIRPASIAGHVYFDANDNGIFEPGELTIAGAKVTLTGFSDQGPVSLDMTTNAAGEYKFSDLRPGTYALTETQPTGYADGKDTIGTPGGTTGNDVFSNIQLVAGFDGVNNDFGEITAPTPVPPTPIPKVVNILGMLPVITKTQLTLRQNTSNIDPVLRGQMTFVVGTTVTLTNQQPNLAQVMAGVQQLRSGTTLRGYVRQLWNSGAHRALQAETVYKDVLGRAPTAQERSVAVQSLKTGTTQVQLKEQLYVSAEYMQQHPTTEALAIALHEDILNVTPGSQSLQATVQSMANEPLQHVVHALLTSDEAIENQIDDVYRATVRRAATPAEVQTWSPQIKAGTTTLDELGQRLLSSQEFYQLAIHSIR
jgi:hypothetical protein